MATTSPARIDDELYASAKLAGSVQSRSASQQVAHWARIGREIEASSAISHKEIAEVLAGSRPYDSLNAREQAVIRAEWVERMRAVRESLDLADEFAGAGRTWVELAADGSIVERGPADRRPRARTTKKDGGTGRAPATRQKPAPAKATRTRAAG
jgi:hypothetical protein